MVLRSMHDFVQLSSGTSVKSKLLGILCYEDDFFHHSIALQVEQCSLPSVLPSRNSKRDSCGTLGHHFALNINACSTTIGVVSISLSSQGC